METVRFKQIRAVYEEVKEPASKFFQPLCKFINSHDVYAAFKFLKNETKEHIYAVHLDTKNKTICVDLIAIGSLNSAIVHPREVYKSALLSSAAAIIFVHNHTSGDTTPSEEDIEITKRLVEVGVLLGIRVLDHIIVGDSYFSFADQGLI